jgi:hypothetical protein
MAKKKAQHSDWELEEQFNLIASLEELINEPPFTEVSGQSGDSRTVAARVPFWLHRRAKKLREIDGSPYYVDSDVYRDAIYLGLKILNMRHKTNPDWDVESKMAQIIDSAGTAARAKRNIKELSLSLNDLWHDGDQTRAVSTLSNFIHAAVEIGSEWYKRRVFNLIKSNDTIQIVLRQCDKSIQDIVERGAEEIK